jgi:hypothetical protein
MLEPPVTIERNRTTVGNQVVEGDPKTRPGGGQSRRCADATAQFVLNAARRTRKKIKTKARKNRPDRGPTTAAPTPAKPRTGASTSARRKPTPNPQVTNQSTHENTVSAMAPTSHPGDTHRPNTTDKKSARTAFPQLRPLKSLRARRDSNP